VNNFDYSYETEGDYYLVTGVDFNNGHIAFDTCHFVTKERYDQDQHIQLQLNDVLVTKDGTIGKVAFIDSPIDKPATLNSGVFVVRPKNPNLLLPEYLMIMLMSNHFSRFIEQIKVGCTIAHLNQEKFLRYEFPLPPVAEQKHIIEVYYSVSKIINHRQRQLRALDTLIKARFVEMFGDPVSNPLGRSTKKLSELGSLDRGRSQHRPRNAPELLGGAYPLIQTGEVSASVRIILLGEE
jgi:type I restriction enzyme S subunit